MTNLLSTHQTQEIIQGDLSHIILHKAPKIWIPKSID